MTTSAGMYSYWGKARPQETDSARPYHLLVYHSLDVAAVGQQLLARHPSLLAKLAAGIGIDPSRLRPLLVFLLAIHDLGKFAETFQALQPGLMHMLQGRTQTRFESVRHDSLGYLLWNEALWPELQRLGWFGIGSDRREQRQWRQVFEICLRAVTGHHGQPPKSGSRAGTSLLLENFFSPQDVSAAVQYLLVVGEALLGPASADPLAPDPKALGLRLRRWSWWLAGFAVLCDWIGSNQDYFGYETEQQPLQHYWRELALPRAEAALEAASVLPAPAAAAKSITELFHYIGQPTPLQQAVSDLPLAAGPQLFILEDVTGAGKTEAALMLTHRLMSAGAAEGAYLALPTMATANAMYQRMADSYRRLFADGTQPSLVLAHGARDLDERFRQSILPAGALQDLSYSRGEDSATAQCAAWLADQRKKALLAQVGVGTIDQALLGILYSRHQSLRLFGLLGKVLVVDEVHACDAYVNRLLRTLLTFHAAAGGSALLLSATLPAETRAGLVEAFCAGAGYDTQSLHSTAYPLLTHVTASGVAEHPLETRAEVQREVAVEWLTDTQQVIESIARAAAAGRCVCWIRNTVADALEAWDALKGLIPSERLHLFHARYALADRLDIETRVLGLFGKGSLASVRAGQVLVATQVVEQSLDLDFDLLISDLAPVDLLIQRAGRLHRHRRDAVGNPLDRGEDQRGGARLLIHGPLPSATAQSDWYKTPFPRAAHVYPDHARLWLTAHLLVSRGGFRMPEDARRLIEGVYGEEALAQVPEALQEAHFGTAAVALAHTSLARQNSVDLDAGYATPELDWWDDTVTPTRLGDPVSTIRLARWEEGRIVPWASGPFAWQRSEVSVRHAQVAAEAEYSDPGKRAAVEAAKDSMPDKGKWTLLLVLETDGNSQWIAHARNADGREVAVAYCREKGLMVQALATKNKKA